MFTFKEVIARLGDAQVSGGGVVVYRGGKHIDIGRVASETGTFILTPAGLDILNAVAVVATVEEPTEPEAPVVEAPKKETPAQRKAREKKQAANVTDELGDLDDFGDE